MTTTAEKIAVMQAYEEGKEIEIRSCRDCSCVWTASSLPRWDWARFEYRVKPEPLGMWVNMYVDKPGVAHTTKEAAENVGNPKSHSPCLPSRS